MISGMMLIKVLKSTKSSDIAIWYAICYGHYFSQAWSLTKYFYPQQHRNIIIWEAAFARMQHNIQIKHAVCIFHMVYVTTHFCIVIAIRLHKILLLENNFHYIQGRFQKRWHFQSMKYNTVTRSRETLVNGRVYIKPPPVPLAAVFHASPALCGDTNEGKQPAGN